MSGAVFGKRAGEAAARYSQYPELTGTI